MSARLDVAAAALGAVYAKAPTAEEVHWQLQGLCRHHDPRMWTPDPPCVEEKSQQAKKICLQCPVIQECRDWALEHREAYGVWGGLTEEERDRQLSGRARKRREDFRVSDFYSTA